MRRRGTATAAPARSMPTVTSTTPSSLTSSLRHGLAQGRVARLLPLPGPRHRGGDRRPGHRPAGQGQHGPGERHGLAATSHMPHRAHAEGLGQFHVRQKERWSRPATAFTSTRESSTSCTTPRPTWSTSRGRPRRRGLSRHASSPGSARSGALVPAAEAGLGGRPGLPEVHVELRGVIGLGLRAGDPLVHLRHRHHVWQSRAARLFRA